MTNWCLLWYSIAFAIVTTAKSIKHGSRGEIHPSNWFSPAAQHIILAQLNSLQVRVCSAQVRESVEEEAMRVGVQAFFTKPIDIDLFAKTIAELLAG